MILDQTFLHLPLYASILISAHGPNLWAWSHIKWFTEDKKEAALEEFGIISKLVLVNGEPGEIIKHHRGLRQGDPLHNPYSLATLRGFLGGHCLVGWLVPIRVRKRKTVQQALRDNMIVDFLIIWDLTQDIHLQPRVLQGSTLLKQPTNTSIFQDWWSMAEGLIGFVPLSRSWDSSCA
ncbi:hypothetical protein ACJX0J_042453, partial [Zea mays]